MYKNIKYAKIWLLSINFRGYKTGGFMIKNLKKVFLSISILSNILSMNFIKADIKLINGIQKTINIYSSINSIEKSNPVSIASNETTSLPFPTSEKYFVIKLEDDLIFQFFYSDFNDNNTFIIFLGINNEKTKYSCALICTNKQHLGYRTKMSIEKLNENLFQHSQSQENKVVTDMSKDLSTSAEEKIEKLKEDLKKFLQEKD